MGILSNFLGLRDGNAARTPEVPPTLRPAVQAEVERALRLILGGSHGPAAVSDDHVCEFLTFANQRGIDLSLLWVADQSNHLTHAVLPVVSPGRTMLLFVSAPGGKSGESTLAQLIQTACNAAASARGIHLAQALIDPQEDSLIRAYDLAGFEKMAELIYLNTQPKAQPPPPLPPGLGWRHYSSETHAAFGRAILGSYHESLDCPALNGLRSIDDVIDGHKASGVFDPTDWFLLVDESAPDADPLGVLLLASSGRAEDVVELVYLGLSPAARGRKLSELLMKQAIAVTTREPNRRLSLAVDARNVPALKLYYRHGMNRVTSKVAMMRDLRELRNGSE